LVDWRLNAVSDSARLETEHHGIGADAACSGETASRPDMTAKAAAFKLI
jgi:hypothetical protein